MNNIPKSWQTEQYKKDYPPGTRIKLTTDMEGENMSAGSSGSVIAVAYGNNLACEETFPKQITRV